MSNPKEAVQKWLTTMTAPSTAEFFATFSNDDKTFIDEEGLTWDFKDKFPFSYSDDYFYGICRLICAFYNTFGGAIVFGVDDQTRLPSRDKVQPNTDKLKSSFKNLCDTVPDFVMESFRTPGGETITLLLVPPRVNGASILKFSKNTAKYSADIVWVRDGHEVVSANPKHFPTLFARRGLNGLSYETGRTIDGYLPSSPATIRNFVGRISTLEKLFDWIENSEDPIQYLSGKGGSGKTTIGYEFAKLIKDSGSSLKICGSDYIDIVVFISAKKVEFNPESQSSVPARSTDFEDYEGMLRATLRTTGLSVSESELESLSIKGLEEQLKEILDSFSMLLVVDDVDTLTTAGKASGTEAMLRLLYQSRRKSRLLYTLRQRPSMAISTTIEVPGLDQKTEMPPFLEECIKRFKVERPSQDFIDRQLGPFSEFRPLIVETVMALRRTSGDYDRALALAKTKSSEDMLGYVFEREWERLKISGSDGNMLLVALHELGGKATFEDLRAVLGIDDQRVNDALANTQEMFLMTNLEKDKTTYQLGGLTKAFVMLRRDSVVAWKTIREKAKHFKQVVKAPSEAITQLERNAKFQIRNGNVAKAYQEILSKGDVTLMSDPFYRMVRCTIGCQNPQTNFSDIKSDFQYVVDMKAVPNFQFYYHYAVRCEADSVLAEIEKTMALVSSQNFGSQEKAMISVILGRCKTKRSKAIWTDDTEKGLVLSLEATQNFLNAFFWNCEGGAGYAEVSEQNAYNTMYHFTRKEYCIRYLPFFVEFLENAAGNKHLFLDPIQDLLIFIITNIRGHLRVTKGEIQRFSKPFEASVKNLAVREKWLELQSLDNYKEKCGTIKA